MYFGNSINDSPVIAGTAAADFTGAAMLAVTMDADGVKLATAGEAAMGLLIAETDDIKAGDRVTVQIKDCGLWKAGEAIAPGDMLASDDNGQAVKAAAGDYILGQALEAATAEGQIIRVQVIKAGFAN